MCAVYITIFNNFTLYLQGDAPQTRRDLLYQLLSLENNIAETNIIDESRVEEGALMASTSRKGRGDAHNMVRAAATQHRRRATHNSGTQIPFVGP